jgi:hypothetical protein
LRIPSFFFNWRLVSSSDGTEESSEESSESMLVVVDEKLIFGVVGFEEDEVRGSLSSCRQSAATRRLVQG